MNKLYVVMVGLPARGKSTMARRIREGLEAEDFRVEVFNNGEIRRSRLGVDSARPEFYDPDNAEGRARREEIARLNIAAARDYLAGEGHVAILDATNASRARRATIEAMLTDHPLLFVECVNNDPVALGAAIRRKTQMPEFARDTTQAAMDSFTKRIHYYERMYAPCADESCWVRVDTLENRVVGEQIGGRVPYYHRIRDILVSAWVRNLYLVRHGETYYNVEGRIGGDSDLTLRGQAQAKELAAHFADIEVPYIFTSTRKRSAQTAAPMREARPEATVMALPEFDEIDAGACEGLRYDDIRRKFPQAFAARQQDKFHYVYPDGEGYVTLRERVERGVRRALFLAGGAPGVMIIGHQAINRMILSHFLYRRTEDVPYIFIPQTQYYHIVATQRKKLFELVRFM